MLQDLRTASRALLRRPGFTATAVATLALGIGANTLIFSIADGVLFRPLPYAAPDRLVTAYQTNPVWIDNANPTLRALWDQFPLSYTVYEDWLELSPVFEELGVYSGATFTLMGDQPERLSAVQVTSGVFAALGVRPLLGRLFLTQDDRIGAETLVILSHGLWQRRFGSDSTIVGQTVELDDRLYTVVGVMPRAFYFPDRGKQLWATIEDADKQLGRDTQFLEAIARLKPGVTLPRAQQEMEAVTERIAEANPGEHYFGVRLLSYKEGVVGDVRPALLLFLAAVGLVLLIACANIANLLLVRATERHKELAVRSALGAGRGRLLAQLLGESVVLSIAGGAAGLLLAFGGLKPLTALFPPGIPRVHEISIDYRVLVFAAGLSLLTGLLTGLLPALAAARTQISDVLREASRGFAGGRKRNRTQGLLVISEVALAFVLLVAAGLLLKSFVSLTSVERGFVSENLLTMNLSLPESRYSSERARAFYSELYERLAALPGVQAVAAAGQVPLLSGSSSGTIQVENAAGIAETNVHRSTVTPSYFQVMGVPVLAGRAFTAGDREGSALVAAISQSMAQRYWPGENPIGHRIKLGSADSDRPWRTIVGVVGDVRHQRPHIDPQPWLYLPVQQRGRRSLAIVLKTSTDPSALARLARTTVWAIDPDLPVVRTATLDELIKRSVATPRFRTTLLGLMAGLAILLAVVGVYGVIAHAVALRTQEIGVRMALGARPVDVVSDVLRRGAMLAVIGLGLGLATSAVTLRVLDAFLFEVSSSDPTIAALAAATLAAATLLASYVPARRASRMNPVAALRE